eukprot:CAMPEP_0197489454 /NCGR_PEP_ID=MMETSP1311-20131121/4240_1 /TAXON_ID=464262 /ORGANISM="Genus nov. species nov., Strain RCC856" /LENGTH=485 /DNA_ID=CAMNT_0043033773 /DNA_START=1 /DNA_END=1458 /DNA_ORIENTATION=+
MKVLLLFYIISIAATIRFDPIQFRVSPLQVQSSRSSIIRFNSTQCHNFSPLQLTAEERCVLVFASLFPAGCWGGGVGGSGGSLPPSLTHSVEGEIDAPAVRQREPEAGPRRGLQRGHGGHAIIPIMGTHEPAAAMGATAWRMMLPPRGRFAATAAAADAAVDNVTAAAVVVVAVAVVLYCTGSTFVVFHIGSKGAHVALLRHAALAALIPAPPRPGAGLAAKRSLPLHGGHHHLRGLEASEAARGCRRRRRRRRRPSLRVALCSLVERRAAQVVHADHAAHVMGLAISGPGGPHARSSKGPGIWYAAESAGSPGSLMPMPMSMRESPTMPIASTDTIGAEGITGLSDSSADRRSWSRGGVVLAALGLATTCGAPLMPGASAFGLLTEIRGNKKKEEDEEGEETLFQLFLNATEGQRTLARSLTQSGSLSFRSTRSETRGLSYQSTWDERTCLSRKGGAPPPRARSRVPVLPLTARRPSRPPPFLF